MTEWRAATVAELCKRTTSGGTPSRKRPEYFCEPPEGIPWVRSQELVDRRIKACGEHITEAGLAGSSAKLVPAHSVLVAMYGATVGQLGYLDIEAATNQAVCVLITDQTVTDSRFLYYALMHERARLVEAAHGAAQQNLSQSSIRQFSLRVPAVDAQRRIAQVLGAIDDLIENNRRRVELLEEMARAIYREWFVHFRYPGHEDIPLVDSPLGPIPDGWRLGVLRDLATEIRRSVKPSAATAELPYLPIDAIDPQSITVWGHRPGTEAKSSLRLFDKGDVVFGAMRAYFHKVCVAPFDGVTRSTCFVLRADPEHYWYAALTLAETSTVAYAAAHSSGSTIPYAKWEGVLSEMPVILPPASVSEAFAERVQPLLGMAQNLADQAQPLASLRDRLLPKLVTGRIDVSHLDLEHLAEAVSA